VRWPAETRQRTYEHMPEQRILCWLTQSAAVVAGVVVGVALTFVVQFAAGSYSLPDVSGVESTHTHDEKTADDVMTGERMAGGADRLRDAPREEAGVHKDAAPADHARSSGGREHGHANAAGH
jgi:hypothetical protein